MRQLKITKSITVREERSLEKYLQEISRIELLSPERETELAEQIQKGDEKAITILVNANLRFVVSVAKQFQNQGLSLTDLINEGNIGLVKAAGHFDHTRGFKFISYAIWWIRQSIMQAISENARIVKLPVHKSAIIKQIEKASSILEQSLERTPTDVEIAALVEMEANEVGKYRQTSARHASLDASVSDNEEECLMETIVNQNASLPDQKLKKHSLHVELDRVINTLSKKEQITLCYYFGIGIDHPLSLQEIAIKLKVTRERVRQIKDKAVNRLRTPKNMYLLQDFIAN